MLQRKPDAPAIDGVISVISDHVVASRVGDQAGDTATADDHTLSLEQIASDALDQLRQLTQEHATLGGQVLALERQVRTLLIERRKAENAAPASGSAPSADPGAAAA